MTERDNDFYRERQFSVKCKNAEEAARTLAELSREMGWAGVDAKFIREGAMVYLGTGHEQMNARMKRDDDTTLPLETWLKREYFFKEDHTPRLNFAGIKGNEDYREAQFRRDYDDAGDAAFWRTFWEEALKGRDVRFASRNNTLFIGMSEAELALPVTGPAGEQTTLREWLAQEPHRFAPTNLGMIDYTGQDAKRREWLQQQQRQL